MTADDRLDFVLPGTWWRVPLAEGPKATDAAIRHVTESILGKRDEAAGIRAELRAQLRSMVAAANEVGAAQLHFARSIVGALPFPVSLTIAWPDLPVTVRGTPAERSEVLRSALPDGLTPEALNLEGIAAARTAVVRPATYDLDGEALDMPHFDATYWVAAEGIDKIAVFAFTTPMQSLQEEMLELFDAVISTISVREVATA